MNSILPVRSDYLLTAFVESLIVVVVVVGGRERSVFGGTMEETGETYSRRIAKLFK